MDSINVLSLVSKVSGMGSSCNCSKSESNSVIGGSGFDLVLESLMMAVSEKNKQDGGVNFLNSIDEIADKVGESTVLLDNIVSSNVSNTTVVSKIEPTNKDESINIRIKNAVSKASQEHGIDADLIMAVIKVESNFNPNCTSKAGAKGLMQLMPVNVRDYGVKDVFNIEENIDAGTRQLKDYINMFDGSLEMGLMAYNAGQGTMKKRGVTSPDDLYKMPKETRNYVPKVLNLYRGN